MPRGYPGLGPLNFPSTDNSPGNRPPLGCYNTTLTGVTRDVNGAALGGCTVKLFRKLDDSCVASTVSDGSGNFTFLLAPTSGTFFFRATDSTGLVVGTSLDTLVGV